MDVVTQATPGPSQPHIVLGQACPVPQECEDLGWPGWGTGRGSPRAQLGWFLPEAAGCWPPASVGRSSIGPVGGVGQGLLDTAVSSASFGGDVVKEIRDAH